MSAVFERNKSALRHQRVHDNTGTSMVGMRVYRMAPRRPHQLIARQHC
jgi:hypothetical protein